MIKRRMDDKLEVLKAYFNTKLNEQEQKLTKPSIILLMISKKRSSYKYKTKFQNDVRI